MRKAILALLTFILCLSGAEVKVEKVLETISIKEYNQWMKKNKAKYPTLERIAVTSECVKNGEEYRVSYYNADGNIFKKEILKAKPGIWLSVILVGTRVVSSEIGRHESEGGAATFTARDSRGNFTCSFTAIDEGSFYLPQIGFIINNGFTKGKVEIIDWHGNRVGDFPSSVGWGEFGISGLASSSDQTHILLSLLIGNPNVALWDYKEGTFRELWHKGFASAIEISISSDGQYNCIGDSGCIFVYDTTGILVYSYCFPKRGRTNPISDFSIDNNYLVCALSSQMSLIDNKTGKPMWEIGVPGDEFVRKLFFIDNGKYIGLTHHSVNKIYIYDLNGTLQKTIDAPTLGCSVVDDLLIFEDSEKGFHKTIYRIREG